MKTCNRCGGAILPGAAGWGGPICYCQQAPLPYTDELDHLRAEVASLKEERDAWKARSERRVADIRELIARHEKQLAAANGRVESVKKIIRFWIANFHNGYPEKHNLEFVLADIEETSEESDLPEADKEKS